VPPILIEFRARATGEQLTKMPLYEFLRAIHCNVPMDEESFEFEEMRIFVDGKELFPAECGHA